VVGNVAAMPDQEPADDREPMDETAVRKALGGVSKVEVGVLEPAGEAADVLARLIEHEHEVVAALHAVIPHSGQEPRSEALEHLLEHVIIRKQQQTDYLSLALA